MTDNIQPVILIAEDEAITGLDLSNLVEETGYRVDGPHTYRETALASLERRKPDCAILDVKLTDGEVFPLAEELSKAGVPIIFYSGQSDPAALVDRFEGAAACGKPCPPSELIGLIRSAVSGEHEAVAVAPALA